jgi:MFS family permease
MTKRDARVRGTGWGWTTSAPLGLLALTHFLMQADRNLPALILPLLKRQFLLSDTALGLLQGPAFALFFVAATLAAGQWVDRAPPLKALAGSLLLWTLAGVGFGLARTWEQLVLCRLALGLCQALVQPAALSLIVARTPAQDVGRSISVFTTGSALGRSGALLLGGALLAWSASPLVRGAFPGLEAWRVLFFLSALPNLVVAAGLLVVDGRKTASPPKDPVPPRRPSLLPALEQMRIRPATFGVHLLAAGCVIVLIQAASAWLPTLMQRELALSPARSGLFAGLIVLVGAPLGHLSGGVLTDLCRRAGRPPSLVVAAALALCVVGAGLLCGTPTLTSVGLGFFLLTVFGGAAAVVFLAMYQPMLAGAHGASNAIFFAATTLIGVGLGPPVIGLLSDRVFGPGGLGQALFWTTLAASLAAALLAWGGRRAWARVVQAAEAARSGVSSETARGHG